MLGINRSETEREALPLTITLHLSCLSHVMWGCGRGLGRVYALAFAERGAKVVVNDFGGDTKGTGQSSRPADAVVAEIRAKGGIAVANYDSVENGEKIIQTAIDNFGRIDIVINNAGILRDRSFTKLSDTDWDLVQKVHLKGGFKVTRAAWSHMKQQGYGRIIMTSSPAAVYGNFGQANYAAAKFGLLGLSNTLSIEGAKYNIYCNTIVPTAYSRMTENMMPPDMQDAMRPETVVPLVLWLSHEDCKDTGCVYEATAGCFAKLRWQKSGGLVLKSDNLTPETVRDNWMKVNDFSKPLYHSTIQEQMLSALQMTQKQRSRITPNRTSAPVDLSGSVGAIVPEMTFTYSVKDVIVYALSVGVTTKQTDGLKFLYEGSDEFSVLPTFVVAPALTAWLGTAVVGIDPSQAVHGEQYLELFGPLPKSATLMLHGKIVDILDKGSGAVILADVDVFSESGERLAHCQMNTFVRGAGGYGGHRNSDLAVTTVSTPTRPPDGSITENIGTDQAALYRLNGDPNPLHIDPQFAALADLRSKEEKEHRKRRVDLDTWEDILPDSPQSFPRPILHGLCTLGYAARHVLQKFCNNDVSRFKAIKARFTKPIFPGQTLQTDMWMNGTRIHITCKVVETGDTCLAGGYVDLTSSPSDSQQDTQNLVCESVFTDLKQRVMADDKLVKKVNAVYLFNITRQGRTVTQWTVDLRQGHIYPGEPKQSHPAECTITIDEVDLVAMSTGRLYLPKAFLEGRAKVQGQLVLAERLSRIFRQSAKL
ncbi:Peroxisomal multifunctional enzyme type 2 [Lamellibrachia satsuma]|nr:Peroxisomal multifunctional enzyme type 2 [Lamellibrachia satsuma]